MTSEAKLLPSKALEGQCIAISVSQSPDLGRLGFVETHFRLAVAEVARSILIAGGHIAYGGHLQPGGYTDFLVHELYRYSRRDRPLRLYVSWSEHRQMSQSEIAIAIEELGLFGQILLLDPQGNDVDLRTLAADDGSPLDAQTTHQSLTSMRRRMAAETNARVLIGGRRAGFEGTLPGLVEEAIFSLERHQPLYLVGGFGGIVTDIARILEIDHGEWMQRKEVEIVDDKLAAGLARLLAFRQSDGWRGLANGLTAEENSRLVATHRPTEIATLVSLGLGRKVQDHE